MVEVMGRTKGWIATYATIAAGADALLIPEIDYDLEKICKVIKGRHRRGHKYSIVVVSEGVEPPEDDEVEQQIDAFGFKRLGGVAYQIAPHLERITGFETRVTVLGHLQRGGTPTAYDRVLGTRFGVTAADMAARGEVGVMVALQGERMVSVPLADACEEIKGVDDVLYDTAATFFG